MVSNTNPDSTNPAETQSPPPVQKKNSMDSGSTGGGDDEVPPLPMRKLSRSQSITSSAIPTHFFLPPEMESQWKKRRESLEKLQLDKHAPWMHLHDFTSGENPGQNESGSPSSANSP